jgi:hypothetical protein
MELVCVSLLHCRSADTPNYRSDVFNMFTLTISTKVRNLALGPRQKFFAIQTTHLQLFTENLGAT